jgi:predicted extracellular nuclease
MKLNFSNNKIAFFALFLISLLSVLNSCGSRKTQGNSKTKKISQIERIEETAEVDFDISVPEPAMLEPIEKSGPRKTEVKFRLAFYNLENLFDTIDGANLDEEYLPNSKLQWNSEKYQNKLKNMARVIDSMQPDFLGVCEVENYLVLSDLIKHSTHLSKHNAKIVHSESPDKRGIDVALIYLPGTGVYKNATSELVSLDMLPVAMPDPSKPTRSIMVAHFKTKNIQHSILVNHWPSRSGGEQQTRDLRASAANSMRDYLMKHRDINLWNAVGDFNDNPSDSSIFQVLGAGDNPKWAVNLAYIKRVADPTVGSLRFKGMWDLFDQIMVSPAFFNVGPENNIPNQQIYLRDWLLQNDGNFAGYPLRTFGGKTYLNGYSDHLPVFVDLEM